MSSRSYFIKKTLYNIIFYIFYEVEQIGKLLMPINTYSKGPCIALTITTWKTALLRRT